MRDSLTSLNTATKVLVTMAAVVSSIVGGWLFLATTFVNAADFDRYAENEDNQDQERQYIMEQSVNDLRLDVLEGRLERCYRAVPQDTYKIERLQREISGLESRQDTVQENLDILRK